MVRIRSDHVFLPSQRDNELRAAQAEATALREELKAAKAGQATAKRVRPVRSVRHSRAGLARMIKRRLQRSSGSTPRASARVRACLNLAATEAAAEAAG